MPERMTPSLRNWSVLLLTIGLIFIGRLAEAQGSFGLLVTSSADSILVSNSVTYTITVSNSTPSPGPLVFVTNALPDSAVILATSTSQGSASTSGGVTVFNLGAIALGAPAQMSVKARLTAAGLITNTVSVSSTIVTNTAQAEVVVDVTNIPPTFADLGVAINVPTQAIIANDLTTCTVSATNAGPGSATGVLLTNTLPPSVILKSASRIFILSGNNMIFNLGTLASGDHAEVQISLQPTNAGVFELSAAVGAPGIIDTNLSNNTATTNLTVIDYLPGTLVAVTNSPQVTNPQNGLKEQSILLTNVGTNEVPAARVVVTGLPNPVRLFNAVGTNNGSPFVVYGTNLAAGSGVNLLLQYFPRTNFPFSNSQLQSFAVPAPDLTPPPVTGTRANINISRIVQLANGSIMIEWPAVPSRSYTVIYSDNVVFSNALIAPPAIVAPANQIQWIDYGPPATLTATTNSTARFYKVIQN